MSNRKKVQFIEPYKSKEFSDTQIQVFQEYNSEHLLQFKSHRPNQSFAEFQTNRVEPKIQSLIDDDIDLDDNGESIATKREMMQKFQQFDVFLIKNRDKIEGRNPHQNMQQQIPSLVEGDLKSNRVYQNGTLQQIEIPAFSGLKDLRIDFNRVASNIPQNQLQEILLQNQGQTTNDINSNQNSARFLMINGVNPSSDSINNGETFSFFQNKKNQRRKNKAMTLAQTNNIQGISSTFGPLNNLEGFKIGPKTVQDVILRLSIRSSMMVYRFLNLLKRKIRLNGMNELTQSQLMLINDLSHFYSDTNKNRNREATTFSQIIRNKLYIAFSTCKKYVKNQFDTCFRCIAESKPIDPTSNWMMFWLILQFFFIIVALFYTPLELINGDEYDNKYGRPWILFKGINCLAFFFDILIKFNTGLFEKGQIVMNRREIVKTYFKGSLLYDILALIPITQTLLQIKILRPINLLILLKVQTARKILQQIQEMISQKNNKLQNTLSLLQLLLMICSVCHVFACLFQGIAVLEETYNLTRTNWMDKYGIDGADVHWFTKYNCSLYFAVTTMITVGYGDIVPVTIYETFFVTIAMFVSCGVFAYSFNQIGDLVREQNRMSTEFKNEMVLVNRLLEKKKINRDLKLQVRKFLEYRFYAEPQLSMEEERMVMSKLSSHLRDKVILESNLQIINQCTLLTNNFSKQFLENLALKMNELRVSKNEIIFEQNDAEEDPCLYIIDKGNIEIFVETDKQDQDITILQNLNQGTYFGEMNFFKEGTRSASARASDFTILYGIPKSQFLETIQDYPRDFEQYCYMKDSLIYNNKIRILDLKCYVCGREDHQSKNCNLIHYVADKEVVILKENFSTKQKRSSKNSERKLVYKFNALKELNSVNEKFEGYLSNQDNIEYIQDKYDFLFQDPTLTEENQNVSLTHNTSNIGGVPGVVPPINTHLINGHGQTPMMNPNMNNDRYQNNPYQREKTGTILPDIKRHVSNVYTSGGSVLGDMNHKFDLSKNDISEIESPRSNNERGFTHQIAQNYQQQQYQQQQQQQQQQQYEKPTPNIFTQQNTNSNIYGTLQNIKNPSNRFGQLSTFQSTQNNLLSVNAYNPIGLKKKTALKKYTNYGYEEDDNHNNSFQTNQSPNGNAMIQQVMGMLSKLMQQNGGGGGGQQGTHQQLSSYTNIPHFGNSQPSILKMRGGTMAGGYSGSKMHTFDSEDIGGMFGYGSKRNNNRYLSYLHKKREKEFLLQQMQNQFYTDGNHAIDINQFFDKSKAYTVYYPQHNLNIILNKIESTTLRVSKQPEYFGVYSFCVRPASKKKKQSSFEEFNYNPTHYVNTMKNSQAVITINGNGTNHIGLNSSAIIVNNNNNHGGGTTKFQSLYSFNQSYGYRHKGSINTFKDSPKPAKDTDSQKGKKNSLKNYNSLNHLKASTLRQESQVFGNPNNNSSNNGNNTNTNNDKHLHQKSNFGQLNNASECNSIYQEKEKIYYPKFIFKKLLTLS